MKLILHHMPATIELAVVSLVMSIVLGIPLGLYAGLNPENRSVQGHYGRVDPGLFPTDILGRASCWDHDLRGWNWGGCRRIGRGDTAVFLGIESSPLDP